MSLIGIGLVGAGWMGATLLRRFSEHEGVQVIGVHQRRRDKALEVMNEAILKGDRSPFSTRKVDMIFLSK